MTEPLFLVGAPGTSSIGLARELERDSGVRALLPWNLPAALSRLRVGTTHRAIVWQGLESGAPKWIEPAVRRFGPALVEHLAARERANRGGDFEWLVFAHVDHGVLFDELFHAFPEARFVELVRDGRIAAAGRIPHDVSESETARAGLAWAREWVAHVAPVRARERKLGPRLLRVREEDLAADPVAELARVTTWLGRAAPTSWDGARPWLRAPLAGSALDGFSACRPAAALLEELGYGALPVGERVAHEPELATAVARGWIGEKRLDDAERLLERALAAGPEPSVLAAFGEVEAALGREDRAVEAWLAAIEFGEVAPEAWIELLARPQRPETVGLAARARTASEPRIRQALARWLVARGLDREAAEIAAGVEHTSWS
ncbi:MAG: sulfotransferase [Planctomycetes bacterium]|nr:sulfotransferase [Planctomycetota bacterium]